MLPFLAATHPEAARAMLEYRVRRLPAARELARTLGRSGARFAWESAGDGSDVTPASARLATGELVPIRTGELEEHIVGDVAWAAACYLDWTGDEAFAAGPGRDLFVETARYWASRVRYGRDGRAHIYGVIGPDEYHEPVDDNAFTNVLARWNLRQAAALDGVDEAERTNWLAIADALVDGYDRASGLYEQFAGFFELEPLVIEEIAPRRPIAADLLLGAERTAGAQVLKQADVLMLHHLLPDEVAPGSLVPNLDFYEPRTAHGSSLSPAINASVLARAGRYRPALESLQIAARMDLDDLTGTTAGGLHLATMGGLWQALAFGFGGIRPRGDALLVDPRLPKEWNALEFALRFRGRPLRLRIDRSGVTATPADWQVQRDQRAVGGDSEMKKVLAALDNSLAGKSVLAAASAFAALLDAEVEALHVRTDGERTARNTAEAAGIPLRTTTGPVVERLVEAGRASDVVALAIGARGTPAGRRPLGGTASAIANALPKPVHDRAARRGSAGGVPARARPDRGPGLVLARAALALRAGRRSGNRRGRAAHPRRGIDSRLHRPAAARAVRLGGRVRPSLLPLGDRRRSGSRPGSAGSASSSRSSPRRAAAT